MTEKIIYTSKIEDIQVDMLKGGFFDRWPNPPSPETHYKILKQSYLFVAAINPETHKVVGFINAISDGILAAYIPLLEVLPQYQNKGLGSQLVKLILEQLKDTYMVDIICDQELQPYYEKQGLKKAHGKMYRNYHAQAGKDT